MAEIKLLNTKPRYINIVANDAELQILHEAVRRVHAGDQLSPELAATCTALEQALQLAIEKLAPK